MGCRITDNLKDLNEDDVRSVGVSLHGQERLAKRGPTVTPEGGSLVAPMGYSLPCLTR